MERPPSLDDQIPCNLGRAAGSARVANACLCPGRPTLRPASEWATRPVRCAIRDGRPPKNVRDPGGYTAKQSVAAASSRSYIAPA